MSIEVGAPFYIMGKKKKKKGSMLQIPLDDQATDLFLLLAEKPNLLPKFRLDFGPIITTWMVLALHYYWKCQDLGMKKDELMPSLDDDAVDDQE